MSIDTDRIFVTEEIGFDSGFDGDDQPRYPRRASGARFTRRPPASGGPIDPQYSRRRPTPRPSAEPRPRAAQPETGRRGVRQPRTVRRGAVSAPQRVAGREPQQPVPAVPRPGRARRGWFWLLIGAVVVVGIVGVLVLNTKINENAFRLGDLRETEAELTVQEQQLSQQLADLESPGNLRKAAIELGLVPAESVSFVLDLPDGREAAVPNPGGR